MNPTHLSDDDDINRQCRLTYAQGNTLLRKFHMCSIDVKLKLFKSYCTPLYTSHLWWNYKKASLNKLFVAYHNILKLQLGLSKYTSTSTLCTYMDIPGCAAVICNLIYHFMCRLERSDNDIILSILASSAYYQSRIKAHWRKLLFVNSAVDCWTCWVIYGPM